MTDAGHRNESTVHARTREDPSTVARTDAAFARARARVYHLLAATLDGETAVLERAMAAGDFARFEDVLPGEFDAEALQREDVGTEALAVGYDNLFVVPGPHYVPPFASAHDDEPSENFESDSTYHEEGEAGELFGDPVVSVSEHYARFDFSPERGDGIPDHVAAEFEFVAALAGREADLLADDDADPETVTRLRRAQADFLTDGLDWLDGFAAAVEREDDAEGVFAALAKFAAAVVDWDARTVADSIDDPCDSGATSV
ncbi:MAG: TorA maturation chaperone TorD [Halobacteriales archaeon]|jgi:TorA maturation chaperone TorD